MIKKPQARIVRKNEGKTYANQWLFKEGSLTGGDFDFMVGNIDYLVGPPLHVHQEQTDSFFVLEGALTIQIGDELFKLRPGDFATARPGIPHTFANTDQNQPPVKLANFMTPSGIDCYFNDIAMASEVERYPRGRAQVEEAAGLRVVGPTLAEKLGLQLIGKGGSMW